jgi:dipeptidyl aminopeptidase/acylaminoacyl peptidase
MAGISAEQIADLAIPCEAQIAPDGRRVAYRLRPLSKKDEHMSSALWIADLDDSGQAPRQFTAGEAEDSTPQWSPDGRQIAFLSDRARRSTAQLYLIDASGGEARALTSREHKKAVEQFAWSPGGGHIAFSSADEPSEEDERREKERDDANVYGERWPYARLRVISILTREMSTLVAVDAHVDCFAWSPDGSELAYVLRVQISCSHRRVAVVERWAAIAVCVLGRAQGPVLQGRICRAGARWRARASRAGRAELRRLLAVASEGRTGGGRSWGGAGHALMLAR